MWAWWWAASVAWAMVRELGGAASEADLER